jgi:small subunit ribosomal protein S17e
MMRLQGRVRTKTVKKAARVLIEKYYARLTMDFQMNKKIAEEVAIIPSKRLRNKIAGFTTVSFGPCRGTGDDMSRPRKSRSARFGGSASLKKSRDLTVHVA